MLCAQPGAGLVLCPAGCGGAAGWGQPAMEPELQGRAFPFILVAARAPVLY